MAATQTFKKDSLSIKNAMQIDKESLKFFKRANSTNSDFLLNSQKVRKSQERNKRKNIRAKQCYVTPTKVYPDRNNNKVNVLNRGSLQFESNPDGTDIDPSCLTRILSDNQNQLTGETVREDDLIKSIRGTKEIILDKQKSEGYARCLLSKSLEPRQSRNELARNEN